MDALGINRPIVIQAATPQPVPAAPMPQKSAEPVLPIGNGASETFDVEAVEQRRYETVRRASEQVGEMFVVSDKRFTIFKDSSGQYVTRFTSLRDGKVTYIPEPNLFRLGGESDRPVVQIKV